MRKRNKIVGLLGVAAVLLMLLGSYLGFDIPAMLSENDAPDIGYSEPSTPSGSEISDALLSEDGSYSSKEDVCRYLIEYGRLPNNFITKSEAKALGWDAGEGNLWDVAYGCSIGGDSFGNREGVLPQKSGISYYECDIDYAGGFRGAKRIVYSSDGSIYYTDDHYESFTHLGSYK